MVAEQQGVKAGEAQDVSVSQEGPAGALQVGVPTPFTPLGLPSTSQATLWVHTE